LQFYFISTVSLDTSLRSVNSDGVLCLGLCLECNAT